MSYRVLIGSVLAIGVAVPAAAQLVAVSPFERQPMVGSMAEAVVESKITTGRPYAAEATTEFVQVLGDGNRISRRSLVRIYRDTEGRTRREQLGPDGALQSISIYDPVAHVSYVLNPTTRIAQKSAVRVVYPTPMRARMSAEYEAAEKIAGKIALVAPAELPAQAATEDMRKRQAEVVVQARGRGMVQPGAGTFAAVSSDAKSETIGQKLIDGVPADGTRKTVVFPAGSIGNQQSITVISEQWFAPDLDIFLMTKHSDPRTGETTYSLSNIVRTEPSALLFEVPAHYTIRESSYMRPASR